ncbi:MAG: hypothetical protein ACAI25_09485 [Planctomycetota bacterium]
MSEPLLVWEQRLGRRRLFLVAGAVTVLIFGLGAGVVLSANRGPGALGLAFLGLLAIFVPLVFFLNRWELTRHARVELHSDRLVVRRRTTMHAHLEIAFATLAGFRDGSADHVELVPREGQWPIPAMYLSIPTPNEEIRTKLLAVIVERGVPRLD